MSVACSGGDSTGGIGEDTIVYGTRVHPMPMRNRVINVPPPAPTFEYYGGPVLAQAKVVELVWGANVPLAADVGRFYADITQSEYFDVLSEYATPEQEIARGSFLGLVIHPSPPAASVIDDRTIQTELARLLHQKVLPENDDDTVYMVHFPEDVTIRNGGATSCVNFCAYHGTFQRNGKMVPYAVVPDLSGGCAQGCGTGNKLANTTWVASHVLAQTVTNPAIGFAPPGAEAAPPIAWFDPRVGEISDACVGTAQVAGFVVKTQWSLRDARCRFGPAEGAPFTIEVTPTTQSVRAGTSATVLVKTAATVPRPPTIALSATGVPAGVAASFDPPQVVAGGEATLTLAAVAGATATETAVTIRGTAGTAVQDAALALTVESATPTNDFSVEVTPMTRRVLRGGDVTFTLRTTLASGATETITPSVTGLPAGVTASFAPATVTTGGMTELTVSAGGAAQLGSALLTIRAASPTRSRTATVSLDVEDVPPANDFAVGIAPSSRTVAAGASVSFNVTTSVTSGSAQTVALSASGLPSGVAASFVPAEVTAGGSATLTLEASTNAGAASGPFTVTGTAPSGSRTTTASLTVTAAPPTNDFSVSAQPGSRTVAAGESTTFTVSTAVTSGSAVPVAFAISGLPSGVTAMFAPSSVSAGGSTTLTLATTAGAAQGAATVTITGASSTGSHGTTVSLTVAAPAPSDFSIMLAPPSQTVTAGQSTSFVVSTQVTSGQAETVTLSTTSLPTGVTASFAPPSVTAGGSATMTVTAAADAPAVTGDSFTVRGVAPSATRTTNGSLSVTALPPPNQFSLSVTPDTRDLPAGGSVTYTVDTAVTSGVAQAITLAVTGLPSGVSGSFNPTSVTAGASATLTLNATAAATPTTASFTVSGMATSGTQVDTAEVEVVPGVIGNLIVNGGFEDGDSLPGWTIDAGSGVVERSTATRHSGSWSGRVGETLSGDAVGFSAIYQPIAVPGNRTTTLSFWHYARCEVGFGHQAAYIATTSQVALKEIFWDCFDYASWRQQTVDLTPWAGQTILFYVEADDLGFDGTWIYLDDVMTTTE